MILRAQYLKAIDKALERSPLTMLLGARQVGKSTLAKQVMKQVEAHYIDLESPVSKRVLDQPYSVLESMRGLVIIDEAQRSPELFPLLRVLADREDSPATFLLLGSASPELTRQSNESLAGRVEMIEVRGLGIAEVGYDKRDELWYRGGFPRSFLAKNDEDSMVWRTNFISTFVARDLRSLGFGIAPTTISRFWSMLSHYHGQVWNASEAGRTLDVSPRSANTYLDALEQTYMVRRLQPWFENVGKRLSKSPKIYFRDSGIFHWHQHIRSFSDLLVHPKLGASWEGFVLEEVIAAFKEIEPYYYRVHSGAELDLFFMYNGERIGVEIKWQDAPSMTKSMHVAAADLKLDKLYVIYPGDLRYRLDAITECVPFKNIGDLG